MWRLLRFLPRRVRRCARDPDSARRYGRWLDGALTQLAEALLWPTPLAMTGLPPAEEAIPHQQARLSETRCSLEVLLEEARQRRPPAGMEPGIGVLAHQEYIDVVARCIAGLDVLAQGLATGDE